LSAGARKVRVHTLYGIPPGHPAGVHRGQSEERNRGVILILLWLLGVPLGLIILLWLLGVGR
jgi:hypothetical protein